MDASEPIIHALKREFTEECGDWSSNNENQVLFDACTAGLFRAERSKVTYVGYMDDRRNTDQVVNITVNFYIGNILEIVAS